MGGPAKNSHGVHGVRVLGLWFAGFIAGAYAWQLVLAISDEASVILPVAGLITAIAVTFLLGRAVLARGRDLRK